MEDTMKKAHLDGGDKEIIFSKAIKAGKRIYYLDVKKNLKNDLFLAITESKKIQAKDSTEISFEKHKIFLYKEDFTKFVDGLNDVIAFIRENNSEVEATTYQERKDEDSDGDIKLNIEF
jgi:Protein of unknown function (DUF3276).